MAIREYLLLNNDILAEVPEPLLAHEYRQLERETGRHIQQHVYANSTRDALQIIWLLRATGVR